MDETTSFGIRKIDTSKQKEKKKIPTEDQVFPVTFTITRVIGLWTPSTIKWPLNIVYEIYKIFCLSSILSIIFTVILDIIISEDKSWRAFFETMFLLQALANATSKAFNILLRRPKADHLMKRFTENRWNNLRDDKEIAIIKGSQHSERRFTQFYFTLILMHVLSICLKPIFVENPDNELMVPAYTPCDRSNLACFWMCFSYQYFGYCIAGFVHVVTDSLILNSIDRICAYLEILKYRLLQLPRIIELGADQENEEEYFKERMRDHQSILTTIADLNNMFNEVVTIQFFTSISILCTNIYLLSNQGILCVEFLYGLSYLLCILVQNFFFFWYGYKVTFNSLRLSCDISYMNGCALHVKTKKMLLFTIMNTADKIHLFANATVSLTPETFVKMLKISYSAFNILQRTNKA